MNRKSGKADQAKERILTFAIEEFAMQGYSNASTNQMAERAGVAKGLIFHYFNNKQTLYLACLHQVLENVQKQLDPFIEQMPGDLFVRLEKFLMWKHELACRQPLTVRFLLNVSRLPAELLADVEAGISKWRKQNARLLSDYDPAPWNPNINQQDAAAVLVLLFNAIDDEMMRKMDADASINPGEILDHALRMLAVLKTGFYSR